jgi:GNAT superfamily N-acetyltransferase
LVPEILREPSIEWLRGGLLRAITELLDRSDAAIFIAIVDGTAVGFADVFLVDEPATEGVIPRRYAKVDNLVVSSKMRLGGIGRQLLAAAEGWAREHNVAEVSVKIWDRPGGPRPFYERMGYTTLSRWMVKRLD